MKSIYNFPLKECKQHSFCNHPSTEDNSMIFSKDLRNYIRSVSNNKKLDLRDREIVSSTSMANEFDLKYLKSLESQMDDFNSVKPGIPIVTEEGLSDWCQQSMNRRFQTIPSTRPFLMPKAIHDYLKSVQELTRPTNNAGDKELMTVAEVQNIIEKKYVSIHQLQPRTMENGTAFIYPRIKNRKKNLESVSFSVSESSKPKLKAKSVRRPSVTSETHKNEAKKEPEKENSCFNSQYKLDDILAKQVFEISKKKTKFFQNLAFSSVFLNKIIEKDKNITFMVPPEFKTPLIEQKDIQDFPVWLELYSNPLNTPIPSDLTRAYKCFDSKDWSNSADLFKKHLKTNPSSFEAQYGLAITLERLHCYKLSRKWFIEALKIDSDNTNVVYGLAVTSLKLNEIGNSIYFCKRVLETQVFESFYYVLAICYKYIKSMPECNHFYQLLIENNESKVSIFTSFHNNDWDEQLKSLPNWMQNRADIPFFRRFNQKQLKKLCQNKVKNIEAQKIFVLEPGLSYIVLKGFLKLRDHSEDSVHPKVIWKVQTGQYINYLSHKAFYEDIQYWMLAETNTFVLEIPSDTFTLLSRESRTNKEIVNMLHFQSFPVFKDLTLETLEALVLESIKIKKCHKGQIVRKKISDSKIDKKNFFGVIISGICDLKREDGLDFAMISRGDCFGEEFVFKEMQGFASIGNLVVRTENLEVGFISPQDLLRLPDYELKKIEHSLSINPHIRRCINKTIGLIPHARSQSSNY